MKYAKGKMCLAVVLVIRGIFVANAVSFQEQSGERLGSKETLMYKALPYVRMYMLLEFKPYIIQTS